MESVMAQVVVEEAGRVVLAHCSEVTLVGRVKDRLAVAVTPFNVAVTVAA